MSDDRPRAWNSSLRVAREWMRRNVPLAKVNRKRKASEFARVYGSVSRVRAIKAMRCAVPGCDRWPCDNAHLERDGTGRKAHWSRVVPLCRMHHFDLDVVVFGKVEHFDKWRGTDLNALAERLAVELEP